MRKRKKEKKKRKTGETVRVEIDRMRKIENESERKG